MSYDVFFRILGGPGRMICGSKGQYRSDNPQNVPIFNANIVSDSGEKLWHGDLDLTVDEDRIKAVARELGTQLYVLYEMDARFENEESPKLENAIYWTDGEVSNIGLNWGTSFYRNDKNDRIEQVPELEPTKEELQQRAKRLAAQYKESDFTIHNITFEGQEELNAEEYDANNFVDVTQFFKNLDEETSPLHNFWKWVETQGLGTPEEALSKVYLTKEVAEDLKKQVEYWYRVFHGTYQTEYRIKNNIDFFWFDVSPGEFLETPEWAIEGRLYIRKAVD